MGPVTPFFPSKPNFPKCPPPAFPNVRLAWKQPPTRPSYRLTSPLAPNRARPEVEGKSSRVGCAESRDSAIPKRTYPAHPTPNLPQPGLSALWTRGGGRGRLVARRGGKGAGKARGDLSAVASCGQETSGVAGQKALFQPLCKIKMLCKAEFLPSRFRSLVGGEEVWVLC